MENVNARRVAVSSTDWLDLFQWHIVHPFVCDVRDFVEANLATGACVDTARASPVKLDLFTIIGGVQLPEPE